LSKAVKNVEHYDPEYDTDYANEMISGFKEAKEDHAKKFNEYKTIQVMAQNQAMLILPTPRKCWFTAHISIRCSMPTPQAMIDNYRGRPQESRDSSLLQAVASDDKEELLRLIKAGASVNCIDSYVSC
jgi:hypothetical protein